MPHGHCWLTRRTSSFGSIFPFLRVTLPRVLRRTVRRRWRREELWNGNIEAPLLSFFTDSDHIVRWAIRTRRKYSGVMPQFVTEYPHVVVVRLRSQREVDNGSADR